LTELRYHSITNVSKFQLNGDHTAMCDIVLLVVFQQVRNDLADNVFIQRFSVHKLTH